MKLESPASKNSDFGGDETKSVSVGTLFSAIHDLSLQNRVDLWITVTMRAVALTKKAKVQLIRWVVFFWMVDELFTGLKRVLKS